MPNRLAEETSPYLLQHADNPVDWWPWCDAALALARDEDRPILLSIGYSACHWCHVMAHESFEDREIAELMNRHFVCIKVDREERPDLDHIYQLAHQILAGRAGGWPLTAFLAPDGTPFYAGTYFPPRARYGLPAFRDLLARIAEAWRTQRAEVDAQGEHLREMLKTQVAPRDAARPTQDGPAALRKALLDSLDPQLGGFGGAPKFPHAAELDFLLRRSVSHRDAAARDAVLLTLTKMAEGGLFDQLGGGFFRYSTDARWEIPHFEKMLYDNGALLALYADAWLVEPRPLFADVVERTARWALREMQTVVGGYCAALDADSEGEEGRYYVWDVDLLRAALPADQASLADAHYGLEALPNFEGRAWHLRVQTPIDEVARTIGLGLDEAKARIDAARKRLLEVRETRVHPGRDEKILTAWNGLMIRGMARAGQVMGREDWIRSAARAADFVREQLWDGARLMACYKDGRARFDGCLDDYVMMFDGLLALMEAEFRRVDLDFALQLADAVIARFEDPEHGGFLFTGHDHEKLLVRPREGRDGATPSGNAIAARALFRFGHLAGERRYLRAAERAVEAHAAEAQSAPLGFASLMVAAEEMLWPPTTAVVCGPQASLGGWREAVAHTYLPHALVVCVPDEVGELPVWLARDGQGRVNGWVCWGVECMPPAHRADEFVRILSEMVNAPGIG